jgi:hypothetical protein
MSSSAAEIALPLEMLDAIVELASDDITTGCSLALASHRFYNISRRIVLRNVAIRSLTELLSFHYAFVMDRKSESGTSPTVENLLITLHGPKLDEDHRELLDLAHRIPVSSELEPYSNVTPTRFRTMRKIRATQHLRSIDNLLKPSFAQECINQTMQYLSPGLKALSLWIEFQTNLHISLPQSCPCLRVLDLTFVPGTIDTFSTTPEAYPTLSYVHLRDSKDISLSQILPFVPSLQYLRLSGKIDVRKLVSSDPAPTDGSEVTHDALEEIKRHPKLERIIFDIPQTYTLFQPTTRSTVLSPFDKELEMYCMDWPDYDVSILLLDMRSRMIQNALDRSSYSSPPAAGDQDHPSVPSLLESMVKQGRVVFHLQLLSSAGLFSMDDDVDTQWRYHCQKGHPSWSQLECLSWSVLEGVLVDLMYRWEEVERRAPRGIAP